ncbi:hypothetical protein E9549_02045 [Blastococcus sp. MG754426]|uniref:hypothetical protein n=1 Tax=unclassified Blastococcus TaxID=2619396 RepID=UPI001EF0C8BB|nr:MULTISPECIES: hypothetical protein [unclassified Blastococcus]MCF6506195.1 hypothetical protein [Blastococcus sp. MG754426]MCF6510427.1 hypothetical protein [Blastococcus sp. MG754427]MCF6737642.1 hypothetical protein [Blastococcus sp. KM273129]
MELSVPVRGPLVRFLIGVGLACAAVLAVVGGIALRGPGLVAVCVSGALAGCVAAGVAREAPRPGRRSVLESAGQAAAVTIGALLVVSGTAVLAGGGVALLLLGLGAAGWAALRWARDRREAALRAVPPLGAVAGPVGGASTATLGEEWRRTGAELQRPLTPAVRQRLVARRAQVLDELERRDPDGFARWLAAGPLGSVDPTGFVRGTPPRADPSTETEAA